MAVAKEDSVRVLSSVYFVILFFLRVVSIFEFVFVFGMVLVVYKFMRIG